MVFSTTLMNIKSEPLGPSQSHENLNIQNLTV